MNTLLQELEKLVENPLAKILLGACGWLAWRAYQLWRRINTDTGRIDALEKDLKSISEKQDRILFYLIGARPPEGEDDV